MKNHRCKKCDYYADATVCKSGENICCHPDSHSFLLEVTEDMGCEYWTEKSKKTK